MTNEEKKAIKDRLLEELSTIEVDLNQMNEEDDFADAVCRIGNVGQSILIELGVDPGQVPEAGRVKGITKLYTAVYLQMVKLFLAKI